MTKITQDDDGTFRLSPGEPEPEPPHDKHKFFQDRLLASQASVDAVADHLRKRGLQVEVPELYVPATASAGQADAGDILVTNADGLERRVEVKCYPSRRWGNLEWCVYGLVIDRVAVFDEKDPVPYCYYITDADLQVARVFMISDWEKVYTHPIRCANTQELNDCYLAHPKHFKVVSLNG